ncbi:hypothetical protein A6A05_16580 [Magnetospirillum moscoviense]|uniref:Uncharacterized protein n=1 Tax=Magnetospirillum moscoviense TaxID=1437059 RepID=A0A178MCU4_9PROT|nr:hypothetical protein A6A05_16580 [Magnetospirillum moscoviense]
MLKQHSTKWRWAYQSDDDNDATLGQHPRHLPGTTDVLGSVVWTETEICAKTLAQIVTVDNHALPVAVEQIQFQRHRQSRLP